MESADVRLRITYRSGDWGWVIQTHGTLYAAENGWGQRFEAMVARLVSDFANSYDPGHDRFWFAEHAGQRLGSIFLTQEADSVGRLRFFLIEPEARGHGIGRRLLEACIAEARTLGHTKMVLATHADLLPARRLYADAGFTLSHTVADPDFGGELEHWELDLRERAGAGPLY